MPSPAWLIVYELCAIFNCLTGCHASLLLASASIHLHLPKLMVLAALQFSVQSIFSLHFISMCGLSFPVPWGFDVCLALASFAIVVIFGTCALTLTLHLRHQLEPCIQEEFLPQSESMGWMFYAKLLHFILSRVSYVKLVLAVLLMVVGAAGCHHVGMWSIHGLDQGHITSSLNYWSFLTTVLLGGTVCVIAILTFLLMPEGMPAMAAAVLLTGGIAAFHFSSAVWGMDYVIGTEGVTTGVIMGGEVDTIFLVVQGVISQVVTAVFSQMVVRQHAAAFQQLQVAQTLGLYIAEMDLEPAKAMQLEVENPSELEKVLFQIVNNLLVYRPYLPDTLFATGHDDEKEPGDEKVAVSERLASLSSARSSWTCSTLHTPETPNVADHFIRDRSKTKRFTLESAQDARHLVAISPRGHGPAVSPRGRAGKKGINLALGLRSSHLTVLRIRLQGLQFGAGKVLHNAVVDEWLTSFMAVATAQIKAHGGTIVTCTSGFAVAFWATISPDAALETAVAIQQHCDLDLTQVVQSAPFLSGNLGMEQVRCFNLVGPQDWAGQLLLRVGSGRRHVLITSHEWQSVRFKYKCLPLEQVLLNDIPTTVYTVLFPASAVSGVANAKEWMYEVQGNLQSTMLGEVDKWWQAYLRGNFAEVKLLARSLSDAPLWYRCHLESLADEAIACQVTAPTKSLEALGWPSTSASVNQDSIRVLDLDL